VRIGRKREKNTGQVCPLCGGEGAQPWFRLGDWTVHRCRGCSFAFTMRTAGPEGGALPPDDSEYRGKTWTGKEYLDSVEEFVAHYDPLLAKLEAWVRPGRLLDIGCGPGFLMEAARRRGWEVIGVDPSAFAARYVSETFGLQVVTAAFDTAEFAEGSFDAITMIHSVEHVPDPIATVTRVRRLLRTSGVVFIETPNLECDESRGLGEKWYALNPSEHASLFSPATLALLLEKAGLRALEISAPVRAPVPSGYVVRAWAERAPPPFISSAELAEAIQDLLPTDRAGESVSLPRAVDAFMTRGEAAVTLAEALGLATAGGPEQSSGTSPTAPFTDVPAEHPAFRHIYLLRDAGIVTGHFDSTFAPDDHLLRGDLQRLIDRCREWLSKRGR